MYDWFDFLILEGWAYLSKRSFRALVTNIKGENFDGSRFKLKILLIIADSDDRVFDFGDVVGSISILEFYILKVGIEKSNQLSIDLITHFKNTDIPIRPIFEQNIL